MCTVYCVCPRTPALTRRTLGPFFSSMMHFAFTGKKASSNGQGKALTALTKVRNPAMAELLESILKVCLPQFGTTGSDESMVEKLHQFLANASPTIEKSQPQQQSTGSSSTGHSEESQFKALVFFATEGLGVEKLEEGEDNSKFGQKLSIRMADLGLLSKAKKILTIDYYYLF